MALIQFRINKGKKIIDTKKQYPLYVRYRDGRDLDFQASLKVSIYPQDWDEKKERVKNRTSILDRHETNQLIENLRRYLFDFENKNRANGNKPTYDSVKNHFHLFFSNDVKKDFTLLEYIDHFIENGKSRVNPHTNKWLSKQTIKSYESTRSTLRKFYDKRKFDFEDIDMNWYYRFVDWHSSLSENYTLNYTGKHIKNVKAILNDAFENEIMSNVKFRNKKFKVLHEDVDHIYLTSEELTKIYDLEINDLKLDLARDLFLLGAHTSLRVSDFKRISDNYIQEINGVRLLKMKSLKTGVNTSVVVNSVIESILSKYGANLPQMPDQKINEYIKIIGKRAGITKEVSLTKTIGGRTTTKNYKKYELISTHTARRSYCTNALLSGHSTYQIMAVSGHKSETNLLKYLKATPDEIVLKMLNGK